MSVNNLPLKICAKSKSKVDNCEKITLIKRENERKNEVLKTFKKIFIPNKYGDRFIPRRYVFDTTKYYLPSFNNYIERDVVDVLDMSKMKNYWRLHNYNESLVREFGLAEKCIINCCDHSEKHEFRKQQFEKIIYEPVFQGSKGCDWPCMPRKFPLAVVDSTHDLPTTSDLNRSTIFAWSQQDILVAAFRDILLFWNPPAIETFFFKLPKVSAIAFNPKHKNIVALAFFRSLYDTRINIYIICDLKLKLIKETALSKVKSISGLVWHSSGKFLIASTCRGIVFILHYSNKFRRVFQVRQRAHHCKIVHIKMSSNDHYVATMDVVGDLLIWKFVHCKLDRIMYVSCGMRASMDWHPWAEIIVIGKHRNGSIILIDVATKSIISKYWRSDKKHVIHTLSFNRLSGELVVSYSYVKNNEVQHELLVLASMDRVVDVLSNHANSVWFLMWSPDGKRLISAGDDESLTIWSFFSIINKPIEHQIVKKNKFDWCLKNKYNFAPEIR